MKRRRSRDDYRDSEEYEDAAPVGSLTLEPRLRRISRNVVDTKWGPLPEGAQARVKELFSSVERPVSIRVAEGRRRKEAEVALESVLRRLGSRLPKMPFPPNTQDIHFDYEKLLDHNRALEGQLTPATHSVGILMNEIEREQEKLSDDLQRLDDLLQDTKRSKAKIERQSKKTHPLLSSMSAIQDGDGDELDFADVEVRPTPNLQELDEYLEALSQQIVPHLESLQGNASQLEGIGEALVRTRAAVDNVLYEKVEPHAYVQLVSSS